MSFAPQRDWESFESLKREHIRRKTASYTDEERLDEYADIFETMTEIRSQTGIDYRTEERWQEKLANRRKMLECFRKLDEWRNGAKAEADAS